MERSLWNITIMFFSGNCFAKNKSYLIILVINLLFIFPSMVVAQTSDASSPPSNNKNGEYPSPGGYHFTPLMAKVFVIIIVVFFLFGFFFVFGRRCLESRNQRSGLLEINHGNRVSRRPDVGLEPNVIDTFPTFLYSDVKKVKIGGSGALECAICLNEFKDDETLRLVPKCCHAFHVECIDAWLTSHVTCPVCRADLVPVPGELEPGTNKVCDLPSRLNSEEENETVLNLPSHSTDDSLIRANHNYERFTLRLPEDVHNKNLTKPELRRAKSNLVFPSASSSKTGYRSISVGPRSLQIYNNTHQALIEGDKGNIVMASESSSKPNKSPFEWLFSGSKGKHEVGERSSAKLMGNNIV